MLRRNLYGLLLCFQILLFGSLTMYGQYNLTVIATTEDEAPGTGGDTFAPFDSYGTMISNSGDIIFSGIDQQDFKRTGLWRYAQGEIEKILVRGELNVDDFDYKLSTDGLLALSAELTGPGITSFNNRALYLDSELKLKAQSGDFVETYNGEDLFMQLGPFAAWPVNNSSLLFGTGLITSDQTLIPDLEVVWIANNIENDITRFAQLSVTPLPSFGEFIYSFIYPYFINSKGTIVYFAGGIETGEEADELIRVLYRKENDQEPVPIISDRFAFGVGGNPTLSINDITINGNGTIAFSGNHETQNNYGLWLENNGGFIQITKLGEQAPGTNGATFSNIIGFALDNHDNLFLLAHTSDDNSGIWLYDQLSLRKIIMSGDNAPGTNRTFAWINNLVVNGNGEIAFVGDLGIDFFGPRYGVWSGREDNLELITEINDNIDINGDNKTVTNIHMPHASTFFVDYGVTGSGEDGLSTYFNEDGDLVFIIEYGDNINAADLSYAVILASRAFVVNTAGNEPDVNPGDGTCDTGGEFINGREPCTLLAALQESNASTGPNRIVFDIPGDGAQIITPDAPLPGISDEVTIDASHQQIELNGADAGENANGLTIDFGGRKSRVLGLSIYNFDGHGIKIENTFEVEIVNCYIGTDFDGNGHGNGEDGIHITESNFNKITGGVISGNGGNGIALLGSSSNNNEIMNNSIGVDAEGNSAVPNESEGILITDDANRNIVRDNVISGNRRNGIKIAGDSEDRSIENKIYGNMIGTNADGSDAVPNEEYGVLIDNALTNWIGDYTNEGNLGNLISGNTWSGVAIRGPLATGNRVGANLIGTDKTGVNAIPNNHGVSIYDAPDNFVGGAENDPGTTIGNIISGNKNNGITLSGSHTRGNAIQGNIIGLNKNGTQGLGNKIGIHFNKVSDNTVGGTDVIFRNIIAGNSRSQFNDSEIALEYSSRNYIQGNIIGLDKNNDDFLGLYPGKRGIYLLHSSDNIIGGVEEEAGNVISGNHVGIIILKGDNNKIFGNLIGTDPTGQLKRENNTGTRIFQSSENRIGSNESPNSGNIISGNGEGIHISGGRKSVGNEIINNVIGLSKDKSEPIGNVRGIFIGNAVDTHVRNGNNISGNQTGILVRRTESTQDVLLGHENITNNVLSRNGFGIELENTNYVKITNNYLSRNTVAITGNLDNKELTIEGNIIDGQTGNFSGIHLTDSHAIILNNQITNDAGDAIFLEDNARAIINDNNIFGNTGYGVRNITSLPVNARSNWWGDASGPGGSGPGTGDEVSENVDFTDWLQGMISVTVSLTRDTIYTPIGASDSVFVYIRNLMFPSDSVDITATDQHNWIQSIAENSVAVDSIMGAVTEIRYAVQDNTDDGTVNPINIYAESITDNSHSAQDTVYAVAYEPILTAVRVTPDTVEIVPGDSIQFSAVGIDQHNKKTAFEPQWSSTGGTINEKGWYVAGTETGNYFVSAVDPALQIEGSAIVIISTPVNVTEEQPQLPSEYTLYQNYPNPFNPVTIIRYSIPERSNVLLTVYNILGQRITRLENELKEPGTYEVRWDGSGFSTGMYFYVLRITSEHGNDKFRDVKRMIMIK